MHNPQSQCVDSTYTVDMLRTGRPHIAWSDVIKINLAGHIERIVAQIGIITVKLNNCLFQSIKVRNCALQSVLDSVSPLSWRTLYSTYMNIEYIEQV